MNHAIECRIAEIRGHLQDIEDWSTEKVIKWLQANNLSTYIAAFVVRKVNGKQLLSLDTKQLEVNNQLVAIIWSLTANNSMNALLLH